MRPPKTPPIHVGTVLVKRVLITGMSATGKSTVVDELARRGYHAVDVDEPGWSEYGYVDAQQGDGDAEMEWLWCEPEMDGLLDTEEGDVLFIAGCAANQGKFYARLDHIVLLTVSEAVTTHRLATRTNNQFGKTPEELDKVLADKAMFEARLRQGADTEIDTDAPLDAVVEKVLDAIRS